MCSQRVGRFSVELVTPGNRLVARGVVAMVIFVHSLLSRPEWPSVDGPLCCRDHGNLVQNSMSF